MQLLQEGIRLGVAGVGEVHPLQAPSGRGCPSAGPGGSGQTGAVCACVLCYHSKVESPNKTKVGGEGLLGAFLGGPLAMSPRLRNTAPSAITHRMYSGARRCSSSRPNPGLTQLLRPDGGERCCLAFKKDP